MGLAIALLEAFKKSGCLLLATTHYPEIKEFAANTPGFCNARMSFDLDTLLPLYRLEMGIAGESCALHIAERLGLPKEIIQRARLLHTEIIFIVNHITFLQSLFVQQQIR